MRRLAALVCALVLLAAPAAAHDEAEVVDWLDAHADAVDARPQLAGALAPAVEGFLSRHRIESATSTPCATVADRPTAGCRIWTVEYRPPPTTTAAAPESTSPPTQTDTGGGGGMGTNVEQWRSLVAAHFGGNTDAALRVAACESGGNPNARNRSSNASGIFQFLPSTWEWVTGESYPGSVFDPGSNIAAAAKLSRGGSDWSHWVCKP